MTALAEKIYTEVLELPTDERISLIDKLLHVTSFPADPSIEKAWLTEAHRRLDEIRSGAEKTIPGEEVFEELQARFRK